MKFSDLLPTKTSLTDAYVRVLYNDGSMVEPLSKHYTDLKRKDIKSATIVSEKGKPLHTLQIKNDKLVYRKRTFRHGFDSSPGKHNDLKRCIILATDGRADVYWDSDKLVTHQSLDEIGTYMRKVDVKEYEK